MSLFTSNFKSLPMGQIDYHTSVVSMEYNFSKEHTLQEIKL